jgi:hypothetical protein
MPSKKSAGPDVILLLVSPLIYFLALKIEVSWSSYMRLYLRKEHYDPQERYFDR